MEKLKQVGLILGILLVADIVGKTLNLPLPGAILGMIILTILLLTRVIKLESVEDGANTLIGLLSFLFVPILVGAKDSMGLIKDDFIPIIIIIVIATIVVLVVTSLVVQLLNRFLDRRSSRDGSK